MDDTAHAAGAAAAAPALDDPLAANDDNAASPAALAGALELADEARVAGLARALANPKRADLISALLCHELASCHRLMMRFGAMADHYLSHTSPTVDAERRQVGRDAIGFAAIAARLMARYSQGALALPRLLTDVDAVEKRIVIDWGADDGPLGDGGGGQGPTGGSVKGGPASTPPAGAASPSAASAAAAPLRRGRLKNGNPTGDFLAAPRCGAKTRAGCACRPPAGDDERPLPPARRQEHGCPHRRRTAPRPHRTPRPRPPHRRGHRPAFRRRRRQPPPGLDDRPRPRSLRWAWGGSLGFAAAAGRCEDGEQNALSRSRSENSHPSVVTPAKAGAHIPEARVYGPRLSSG